MRNDIKLAAFSIQRRAVAAAVFVGTHLGFSDVRQLTSNRRQAESAAVGFVNWILESFEIDSAALEVFDGSRDLMRAGIYRAAEASLRANGSSILSVRTQDLLSVFAHPEGGSRKEIRQIVTNIWPILDARRAHPAKLDAVALGLYCQTDRLLQ